MKKMDNKGFMLTEVLIVATFLVTTLLFIYIQFNKITRTYETSFKYNTVNGLYNAKNIVNYILDDGFEKLKIGLAQDDVEFINITDCSNVYFSENNYCNVLMGSSNVKTILFTNEDLSVLKNMQINLNQTMIDFINYINYEGTNEYRIIIEFNDNTFASIKI